MSERPAESEWQALLECMTGMAQALERQEAFVKELTLWARLGAREEAKSFFEVTLDTDKKKWVYAAHDGKATQEVIARETSVPQQTVSRWAQEWECLGVLVSVPGGTRRRVVHLSALDIHVPLLPSKEP
jgi:predicted Rossmann fold nucleotide-binding protein DprA/Smf involved in DNA uptake